MADYTSLANIKAILGISSTDVTDDAVIDQFIDAASAFIDGETHRNFIAASATRNFDTPDGPTLYVDDFVSLTSITNGDGTSIPTTEVILLPANRTPKYAIRLKGSSTYAWTTDAYGNREQAIAIVATWGYAATNPPSDIRSACEGIVVNLYRAKNGVGAEGAATITAAGVVITPKDVPPFARAIIDRYRLIL